MTGRPSPLAAVVDASVALKWILPESGSDNALRLRASSLLAPDLLLLECANALWKQVRRGGLKTSEADLLFAELSAAPIEFVLSTELLDRARELAHALAHPVYDCVYVALAVTRRLPLITDDQALIRATARHPDTRNSAIALTALS